MKQEILSDFNTAPVDAKRIQEELDRRIFYFKTLFDTSRELAGLIQPKRIMDVFLLMIMGSLGIPSGLLALSNPKTHEVLLSSRGMSDTVAEETMTNLVDICDRFMVAGAMERVSPPRIQVIRRSFPDGTPLPGQLETLVLFKADGDNHGLLGLASRLDVEELNDDGLDILLNSINILAGALARAFSTMSIQQLNADLQKKNAALEAALEEARRTGEELDKRIFHLKALSELNSELSPLVQTDLILDTFLMVTMGTLGISEGLAILYNRDSRKVQVAVRGMERPGNLSPEKFEELAYACFGASEDKRLSSMSVCRINNASEIFSREGMGSRLQKGFLYLVDRSSFGVIGFGPTLLGKDLAEGEEAFLATQIASFMVFLKNAEAFETIKALNEDLTKTNEDLRRTITDLTEARHTIAILERARARLKSIVQRELDRTGRVRTLDIALIFMLAIVLGVLFNFASPQRIPLLPESMLRSPSPTLSAKEARGLIDGRSAILVDARPRELYEQKHIKGAVNVPSALFDIVYLMKRKELDEQKEIIVYGRTVSKHYDQEVAYRLRQRDHEKVRVLAGGIDDLVGHGFQVE